MDIDKIMNGLAKSGVLSNLASGAAGGVLGGMLAGGRGSKHLGTVMKAGGLAAIGGLVWQAWQQYQQGRQPPATAGQQSLPPPSMQSPEPLAADTGSMLLIRCMVAAAMADGHINAGETQRIFAQIDKLELTAGEKALILEELRHPASMQELVSQVHDLHTATELYASSLVAIDASCDKGREWLAELARQLELPAVLVDSLHHSIAEAPGQPREAIGSRLA